MDAHEYILSKQISWARNKNIKLVGSKGERGRPVYTAELKDNLFQPLGLSVKADFESGDGGELSGRPSKMCALHSSSALGVNIFQYWLKAKQVPAITSACGFCNKSNESSRNIRFEQKYPISNSFRFSPNMDVAIENSSASRYAVFAIECKFSEAYSSHGHSGLKAKYLELREIWDGLPHLRSFAESISPQDKGFEHLHPAQLVKHILGLTRTFGRNKFRLLYLWYDCLGREGAKHRDEIGEFTSVAKKDGIPFHALSYQELIIRLSGQFESEHRSYIKYISERYL